MNIQQVKNSGWAIERKKNSFFFVLLFSMRKNKQDRNLAVDGSSLDFFRGCFETI